MRELLQSGRRAGEEKEPKHDWSVVNNFHTAYREIPRSVRFTKTTMERIGLGAIAVASFPTQVSLDMPFTETLT